MAIYKIRTVLRKRLLEINYKYIRKSLEDFVGILNLVRIGGRIVKS
jgi:hypothetical protein